MRYTLRLLALGALFFLGAGLASANTTEVSSDPSYAAGPFVFYCEPYRATFEASKHYKTVDGPCTFSLPQSISGRRVIAVYKGTVGNSAFVAGSSVSATPTLVLEDSVTFGTPAQDDDYFAVVWDQNLLGGSADAFGEYLTKGTPLPAQAVLNKNYYLLPWKWGSKPPSEFDPVVIVPGILGSLEKGGDWVVDPILHTYDNLIDTFLANGYVENKTLFRFGYDWEAPNEVTAHLLGQKINQIKQICGCSKVDVIAHSMGGLVSLYYAENSEYKNDIDQLFLVATPLSGAPKAYKMWEGGVADFGDRAQNIFMQTKFFLEARYNHYSDAYDYMRHKPIESVHELLPTYDYLRDSNSNVVPPPVNGFIAGILQNMFKVYSKIQVQAILADTKQNDTIVGFIVKPSSTKGLWEHGEPTQTLFGQGDGTVPRASIENAFLGTIKEFDGTTHSDTVTVSAAYIFEQLNAKTPGIVVDKSYNAFSSFLYVRRFSPLNIQIVAPDGKRIGKDFSTNTEINEISDAFYSGLGGESEYIIIPNPLPGTYTIKTLGTGTGGYTVAASYGDTATTTFAEATGLTALGQSNTYILNLSGTTVTIRKDAPLPPVELSPDTCLTDLAAAYKNKWVSKKTYDGFVLGCKVLKPLFKTKTDLEKIPAARCTKAQKLVFESTKLSIRMVVDQMTLLAKDKANTKEGVELVQRYITWFKNH